MNTMPSWIRQLDAWKTLWYHRRAMRHVRVWPVSLASNTLLGTCIWLIPMQLCSKPLTRIFAREVLCTWQLFLTKRVLLGSQQMAISKPLSPQMHCLCMKVACRWYATTGGAAGGHDCKITSAQHLLYPSNL